MEFLKGLRRWGGLIVGGAITVLQVCVWCLLLFVAGWVGWALRGSVEREAAAGPKPNWTVIDFVLGSTIDNVLKVRDWIGRDGSYEFEMLLDAIAWRESGGDPHARGACGGTGLFQLTPIYIDDINLILQIIKPGVSRVSYSDRMDANISRVCVEIYTGWYATPERLGRFPTFEDVARIHKDGPNGYKMESSKQYWLDVKMIMESWE